MIKPIYGAASIGVVRVDDMEALRATYKRVAKEMAGARIVDGAMQAGAADAEETDQVPSPSRKRGVGGPCGCRCCFWSALGWSVHPVKLCHSSLLLRVTKLLNRAQSHAGMV